MVSGGEVSRRDVRVLDGVIAAATVLAQSAAGPKEPPGSLLGWVLLGLFALVVAGFVTWNQWYRDR